MSEIGTDYELKIGLGAPLLPSLQNMSKTETNTFSSALDFTQGYLRIRMKADLCASILFDPDSFSFV